MNCRITLLAVCLLVASGIIAQASKTEHVPSREPLARFPYQIDAWKGTDAAPIPKEMLAVAGVDDYLNRLYRSASGSAIGLYIGYYESQRQGDTIHSPLNCLPGAGWHPVSRSYLPVQIADATGRTSEITVNRYVIEKGLERQVVLYWYQSHGRVIANEYRSKLYLVFDAVRLNRSDAALVRVISPRTNSDSDAALEAEARATEFARAMFPWLARVLPS